MTRPNKVFFISNEYNFIITLDTIESYKDIFLQALVSGFGPYPIVSVKVVDKIATVDIGEKVRLYPGTKISIDGTAITDLDTWHEVETVKDNFFTFNVDVPDGDYTNGITMSYPSLGWTLADRNSNDFLLRSGTSGNTVNYVKISFDKNRPEFSPEEQYRHMLTIEKVDCFGTLDSIYMSIPSNGNLGIFLIIGYCNADVLAHNWYFYGDDSFVLLGHKSYYNQGERLAKSCNYNQTFFGELVSPIYKNGAFVINGDKNPQAAYTLPYYQVQYAALGGAISSNVNDLSDSLIVTTRVNERNSYSARCYSFYSLPLFSNPSGIPGRYGYPFTTATSKYISNNGYGFIDIWNTNYETVGSLPGIIASIHMPTMTDSFTYGITKANLVNYQVESFLKPVIALGHLNKRKIYAFYSTSNYQPLDTGYDTSNDINLIYQGSVMLDLTGPIR